MPEFKIHLADNVAAIIQRQAGESGVSCELTIAQAAERDARRFYGAHATLLDTRLRAVLKESGVTLDDQAPILHRLAAEIDALADAEYLAEIGQFDRASSTES